MVLMVVVVLLFGGGGGVSGVSGVVVVVSSWLHNPHHMIYVLLQANDLSFSRAGTLLDY